MQAATALPEGALRWRPGLRRSRTAPTGSAAASRAGSRPSTTSGSGSSTSVTSLFFFFLGGLLSLFMRAQLATPNEHFVTRDRYNELFTVHGTTMVFLVVVPILAGFGNYLVPLMIGARDMAFPRLNALLVLDVPARRDRALLELLRQGRAGEDAAGRRTRRSRRTSTAPGTARTCGSSRSTSSRISSLAGAINFIATIHNMRSARHDLDAHAALRLVDRGLRVAADRDPAGDRRRPPDAPARPAGRHALLHPGPGRQRAPLPAHLLVLRPPRGVRPDPPGDGDDLRDHPRLRAQADLRLQGGRVLDGRASRSSRCWSGRTTCSRSGSAGGCRASS